MTARQSGNTANQKGFALLAAGACSIVMIGALGLAVDLGRIFIAKNEAQAYVDSAALDAVTELDGTSDGLQRARDTVVANLNRALLGTRPFAGTQTLFSTAQGGPWDPNPLAAADYRFLQVNASVNVDSYFVQIFGGANSNAVRATAVAGQVEKTNFREGSFPFSPLAHNNVAPDFGLVPGEKYTLRWASNPKLNTNTCAGDNDNAYITQAEAGGGSERGYIEETSSSLIREAIEGDYMTRQLAVGDTVNMTGGAKQTQRDSIINRVSQDSNSTADTYAEYAAAGNGNGRRLVLVPINTYSPDYRVLGFRAFFLLRSNQYGSGGNNPFCAEYVGSYSAGGKHKGASSTSGAFVPRLLQ